MQITAKTWNDYVTRLSRLNQKAGQLMAEYINTHGTADTDALIAYASALVTKYGEGSAELACRMYDALAEAQGALVPSAEPAATASYGEVARMVRSTQNSPPRMQQGVSRLVKRAGADTTLKNACRDGAEWAWVPHGDTCAFCITLASNGWQKASEKALRGGHAEHIHANCDCEYVIRFDHRTTVAGYDPEKYYDQYRAAGGDINKMRRIDYAANRERINAQKRAAYAARKAYSDILNGVVVPTKESIDRISPVKLDGMTDTQAVSLQNAHKSVLQAVLDSKTPDHEAGCFILDDYTGTAPFVSKHQGNIDFPETPINVIGTIHSHPTGQTFSMGDILAFAGDGDLSIMTVVGNNGKVYVFQKTDLFDVANYLDYLRTQTTANPDYKETAESYLRFMEDVLHGGKKYGFEYQTFRNG